MASKPTAKFGDAGTRHMTQVVEGSSARAVIRSCVIWRVPASPNFAVGFEAIFQLLSYPWQDERH
jgi:hypothetical protein